MIGQISYSTLFQLNEKSKLVQAECRRFAESNLAPIAGELDKSSRYAVCFRSMLKVTSAHWFRFPAEQIAQLGQLGYMGACVDKKYGGAGYDLLTMCLIIEELSRCCASTGIIVSIHNCLYAELVQKYGTAEQIQEFLIPFSTGNIGVFALSEHGMHKWKIGLLSTALNTFSSANRCWFRCSEHFIYCS